MVRRFSTFLRRHERAAEVVGAVAVVVALVVGIGFAVVRWSRHDVTVGHVTAARGGSVRTPSGVVVGFAPGALSRDTDVRIVDLSNVAPPAGARWLSTPVDVSLDRGTLRTAATVTIPVREAVTGPDALVYMVTREPDGAWVSEGGTYDPATRSVTTVVAHFSVKSVVKTALGPGATVLKAGMSLKKAYDDITYEAPQPVCDPASQIWTARAVGDNAKVCVTAGAADRGARLRVVNNRLYPQFLRLAGYPAMTVTARPNANLVDNVWRRLGEVNRDYTYLAGRGELELELPGDYAVIDMVATPGLEAVIAKIVVDVLSVAYLAVGVIVNAIQCVLAEPVVADVVRSGEWRRATEVVGPVFNCVSLAVAGHRVLKPDASDKEEKEAKRRRAAIVDAVTTALKDLPTVVETIFHGARQGPAGQHLVAERTPVVPERAMNEDGPMPQAVVDTQRRLAAAAATFDADPAGLRRLVPPAGLRFANTVAGPDSADALTALMMTPPLRTGCDEIGRAAYVYGLADPEVSGYPAHLADLGWNSEAGGLIRSAARAAKGYRVCIMADGTWTVFSHGMPSAAFPTAEADRLVPVRSSVGDCRPPPPVAFLPPDAACTTVTPMNLDGDELTDKLATYKRGDRWTARAVLGRGAVLDLALPVDDDFPRLVPDVLAQLDLDGAPGDEIAVLSAYGAHSTVVVLLTWTDAGLTLVRRNGDTDNAVFDDHPDWFILDGALMGGSGVGCSDRDRDGRPELVEGWYGYDRDPATGAVVSVDTGQVWWAWRGKTLDRRGEARQTYPAGSGPALTAAPFTGITCGWR